MFGLINRYSSSIEKGVMYVATDDKIHIDNAVRSAKSLKRFNDIHVTLYTNNMLNSMNYNVFDNVKLVEFDRENFWYNRMKFMIDSPYHKTLYLDADSYILDSIDDAFEVLDNFDYAICHGGKKIVRHYKAIRDNKIDISIPYAFSPVNGGVQLFKKNYRTRKFLNKLIKKYLSRNYYDDQISIRELLWDDKCKIKFCILPMEYHIGAKEFIELWDQGICDSLPKIFFPLHWNKNEPLNELLQYVDECSERIRQRKNLYL